MGSVIDGKWFQRDASFWKSPDVSKLKRVHLRHPSRKSRYGHRVSLCGMVPLIDEIDSGDFPNPPESMKCKLCLRVAMRLNEDTDSMKLAWEKIGRLIESNARHRRGFRLGEVPLPFVLDQAGGELQELRDAPSDPGEMADLIGVLIHYSIKQGWTEELLEKCLIEKLDLRFTHD